MSEVLGFYNPEKEIGPDLWPYYLIGRLHYTLCTAEVEEDNVYLTTPLCSAVHRYLNTPAAKMAGSLLKYDPRNP